MTTSPGSQKIRVTRSSACCEPTVTTTSSGDAVMPSSAMTSQICSRSCGSPWPQPYCSATAPRSRTIAATISPTASSGRASMYGMPPASETTSGRLATANSARIADAVIPRVRAAYRSPYGSSSTPLMRSGYRPLPAPDDPDYDQPASSPSSREGVSMPFPVRRVLAGFVAGTAAGWFAGLLRTPKPADVAAEGADSSAAGAMRLPQREFGSPAGDPAGPLPAGRES